VSARILVVEDDRGIRGMLERGLRLAGYMVTMAPDLAAARERWTDGQVDLVLLDVMLPDGNGLDLLAERRAAGDETPTVLLTALEADELRQQAATAGASAYLPKPFIYGELLACVRRLTATDQASGSSRGAPSGG
jgi:two-component system, OmpR family, response regulator QseB